MPRVSTTAIIIGFSLGLLLGAPSAPAFAGPPAEQLASQIDRVLAVLDDPAFKGDEHVGPRRQAVRRVTDELIDWDEMGRRTLGARWQTLDDGERHAFVALFSELLNRAYLRNLDRYEGEKIADREAVTLLEECSRKQLKAVAKIAEVVEVPAGTVLARQGDAGNEFYLIMDGSAHVDLSGRRRARLKPGDYFGEMSLLDGEPRSATVVADTPMRLLVIKRRDFSTLLREAPELTQNILVTLSRRLRQAEQAIR